jgi:hypothetical protein
MSSAKIAGLLGLLLMLLLLAEHHQENKLPNPAQPRLVKNILRVR